MMQQVDTSKISQDLTEMQKSLTFSLLFLSEG